MADGLLFKHVLIFQLRGTRDVGMLSRLTDAAGRVVIGNFPILWLHDDGD